MKTNHYKFSGVFLNKRENLENFGPFFLSRRYFHPNYFQQTSRVISIKTGPLVLGLFDFNVFYFFQVISISRWHPPPPPPWLMENMCNTYINLLLVLLDIGKSILLISQPLCRAFSAKPSYEVLRIAADLFGKLNNIHSSENNVVCLHWVRAIKWRTEKGMEVYVIIK